MHRLARLRIYHGKLLGPCKVAFEALLGKMADASYEQEPRDIATMLWSVAKMADLERLQNWRLSSGTPNTNPQSVIVVRYAW